ncbi:MAG: hypothetical protein QM809_00995 [Gordonia sp. (in: high G+C Gram-positive bacteria)]
MANKNTYVDNGWPEVPADEHAVTELVSHLAGALSPFGNETVFPVPADQLSFIQPNAVINP